MSRLSSYAAVAVTVLASTLAPPAFANVITFETAPSGLFTGPVAENGFTYSKLSGSLYVNNSGNPGQDMEGNARGGGGVLKIVSSTGGNFNFDDIDFAAYLVTGTGSTTGSQTLRVEGFLGGSPVGTDQYTLLNTNIAVPKYPNWTTEAASLLSGITVSELDIPLNGGRSSSEYFLEAIDNVVLTPVSAVPEPASLALLATGVLALGWMRRRRA